MSKHREIHCHSLLFVFAVLPHLFYTSCFQSPLEPQNSWNTKNRVYRPQTEAGYVNEYWNAGKEPPFEWVEYDAENSTSTTSGAFEEIYADKLVKTDDADSINYFLHGPGMDDLNDYTISGKVKFASTNAVFGVNFHAQWTGEAEKYSLVRCVDDFVGEVRI